MTTTATASTACIGEFLRKTLRKRITVVDNAMTAA
jgi:hypothetical protein